MTADVDASSKRGREGAALDLPAADALAFEKPRDAQRVRTENNTVSKRWTPEQDEALRQAVSELGQRNWMVGHWVVRCGDGV